MNEQYFFIVTTLLDRVEEKATKTVRVHHITQP